jgi:hypothetical protein
MSSLSEDAELALAGFASSFLIFPVGHCHAGEAVSLKHLH